MIDEFFIPLRKGNKFKPVKFTGKLDTDPNMENAQALCTRFSRTKPPKTWLSFRSVEPERLTRILETMLNFLLMLV